MERVTILLIVLASIATPAAAQATGTAKDREAIKSIALRWQDAWNRHDMKALGALLAEDVDVITVAGTRLSGRREFEGDHARGHRTVLRDSVLTMDKTEVRFIRPGVAVAHAEWGIGGLRERDGTPRRPQKGVSTWLLQKRKGAWLIIVAQNTIARDAVAAGVTLRVLSAVGMRQAMSDLGPEFERATGHRLLISYDSGGVILKRLEGGESPDVIIIPRAGIDRLAANGKLVVGSAADLATSRVGVAVRKGRPGPDISTPEAFKRAMLGAKTIACPDPALSGSSGVHIAMVFERLGIAEAVKPKLIFVSTPDRAETMPGHLVATGRAEIALHQMQELMAVPGVEVVGPLPDDLQGTSMFSAAVMADSEEAGAGKSLIEFLRTPDAKAVMKAKGMEPAAP